MQVQTISKAVEDQAITPVGYYMIENIPVIEYSIEKWIPTVQLSAHQPLLELDLYAKKKVKWKSGFSFSIY